MKNNIYQSISNDFTSVALITIPIGVAINCVAGQITALLKLPIFLDAVGTVFVSMMCGPWVGIAVGMLSNLVSSIVSPTMLPFIFVSIGIGYSTGVLASKRMFNTPFRLAISVIVISMISILISAPIVVILYGGITGGGNSLITALVMASGASIWTSVFSSEGLFTFVDRIITVLICINVIKCLPPKALINYKYGLNYLRYTNFYRKRNR